MKPINLVPTLKGLSNGWVALSKDYRQVRYTAKDFLHLMKKVEKDQQQDQVVLMPITKNFRGFTGGL